MPDQTDTPLILDTHALVWLLDGHPGIDGSDFVDDAERASGVGELYISSISIAEVALLAGSGRMRFVVPVASWLDEALGTPGLQVAQIDSVVAWEAASLPGRFPGDTADRLIVATARLLNGRLATADPNLAEYAQAGHLRVLGIEINESR